MAKIIKTNGEIAEITPKNEKNGFTCEELYAEIRNGLYTRRTCEVRRLS